VLRMFVVFDISALSRADVDKLSSMAANLYT